MKAIILSILFIIKIFNLQSQSTTTSKQQDIYVELQGNKLLREDFLYQDSNYVYFQKDDSYFKISQNKVIHTEGIDIIPTTTYFQDLNKFTNRGLNSMVLYLIGGLTTTGGIYAVNKSETPNLGLGLSLAGSAISLTGFIVQISAWVIGNQASNKMSAIEY